MKQILTALLLAFSLFLQAEMVDTATFRTPEDHARAVPLAKSLRCPQCQNQNLVESNSPIAYDLRLEVYQLVNDGKSDAEIINIMTNRFGHFVNYNPPFQWNTWLLWLAPFTALTGGIGILLYRRRTVLQSEKSALHGSPTAPDSPQSEVDFSDSLNNETPASHTPSHTVWQGDKPDLKNVSPTAPNSSQSAVDFSDVLHNETPASRTSSRPSFFPWATILMFGLIFAVALGYYFSLNRFEQVKQGQTARIEQHRQAMDTPLDERLQQQIDHLQQKLRQNPNDADLWLQLGELYVQDNAFEPALTAYANAEKLRGTQPQILGLAATALYYQAGQRLTERVQQLLQAALAADPQETASLSLLAADAFKQKNYPAALNYWQRLLDTHRPAVDRRTVIQRMKMAEFLHQSTPE